MRHDDRQVQVKEFTKRLVVNVVKNVLPIAGPAQFALDIAQDFHDIFLSTKESDREALILAAQSLTDSEREAIIAELEQHNGAEAASAGRGILSTLQAAPTHDRLRQTVNLNLLGGRGFNPQPLSSHQKIVGAAVASSMLLPAQVDRTSQAPIQSTWPKIPGFEVKGFLGAGAFANVFLAQEVDEHGTLKRSCALKVGELHDHGRFRREVRALRTVSHPNIIDFYGAGVLDDRTPPQFWIAMPNFSGLTLGDLMAQGLDNEQKLLLTSQLLSGLEALHENEIAHRDLKPENALISDEFELKLTDFGLSKDQGSQEKLSLHTTDGQTMGTPAYMSPEQADGKPTSMEADVWSFGVLIFELFTGKLLFRGDSVARVFSNVLTQQIVLRDKDLPREIELILSRCINRDLSIRYKDARELANDLRQVIVNLDYQLKHYGAYESADIDNRFVHKLSVDEIDAQLANFTTLEKRLKLKKNLDYMLPLIFCFIHIPTVFIDFVTSIYVALLMVYALIESSILYKFNIQKAMSLFTLSLMIATSRLIILEGGNGPESAGRLINTFGNFIVGGNYIVGIVVSIILITTGLFFANRFSSRRRSKLKALIAQSNEEYKDLLNGRNIGDIGEEQVVFLRSLVTKKSITLSRLRDALYEIWSLRLSLVFVTCSLCLGSLSGMSEYGMTAGEASATYIILTTGQISAQFLVFCLVVILSNLRFAKPDNILFSKDEKAFKVVAMILLFIGILPGMDLLVFWLLASVVWFGSKRLANLT